MAFTYDLSSSDPNTLLISKVRLNLGDTVEGKGPLPLGSNLDDAEVLQILAQEDNDLMRAVAACCEALANAWSAVATLSEGPHREELNHVSEQYAKRAETLRRKYGGQAIATSSGWTRTDGYQEANDGDAQIGANLTEYFSARRNIHCG